MDPEALSITIAAISHDRHQRTNGQLQFLCDLLPAACTVTQSKTHHSAQACPGLPRLSGQAFFSDLAALAREGQKTKSRVIANPGLRRLQFMRSARRHPRPAPAAQSTAVQVRRPCNKPCPPARRCGQPRPVCHCSGDPSDPVLLFTLLYIPAQYYRTHVHRSTSQMELSWQPPSEGPPCATIIPPPPCNHRGQGLWRQVCC